MRRVLRSLSTVLIVAGVLLIADAAATVVWQEPLSALMAARSQAQLSDELERLELRTLAPADRRALDELPSTARRIAFAARRLRERAEPGDPVGRIVLPTLGKDFVVVDGDDAASLRKGPGVYPDTPLPGEGGTTAVAGHRTTYLAPFRDLDDLRRGDHIRMEMPYGTFTYAVQGTRIVEPDDVSVIDPVGYERLVLTACHPLYSAAERIVVSARLVKVEPAPDLRR
ncbi:MAG: class D sortase [Solirubrobacteraceae bacterium]|nr:class D sortase [Solirubrobacteraceae bacterium]